MQSPRGAQVKRALVLSAAGRPTGGFCASARKEALINKQVRSIRWICHSLPCRRRRRRRAYVRSLIRLGSRVGARDALLSICIADERRQEEPLECCVIKPDERPRSGRAAAYKRCLSWARSEHMRRNYTLACVCVHFTRQRSAPNFRWPPTQTFPAHCAKLALMCSFALFTKHLNELIFARATSLLTSFRRHSVQVSRDLRATKRSNAPAQEHCCRRVVLALGNALPVARTALYARLQGSGAQRHSHRPLNVGSIWFKADEKSLLHTSTSVGAQRKQTNTLAFSVLGKVASASALDHKQSADERLLNYSSRAIECKIPTNAEHILADQSRD